MRIMESPVIFLALSLCCFAVSTTSHGLSGHSGHTTRSGHIIHHQNDTNEDKYPRKQRPSEHQTRRDIIMSLPFLPLISYQSVSLSLTGVQITLSDVGMSLDVFKPGRKYATLEMGGATMWVSQYIAGGHVNTLPFVGQGNLQVSLFDHLKFEISFMPQEGTFFCAERNSTQYDMTLKRISVEFENLNPGSDSGDLINAVLSGLGPDLGVMLTSALNDEQKLHPIVDDIVVRIINKQKCSQREAAADGGLNADKLFDDFNVLIKENIQSITQTFVTSLLEMLNK